MPIYEYACESCGHQFEKLVSIGAPAPPCPECEAREVRKRVSTSGFILKGSGWYKDHYGLKSKSADSSSSSGGKPGGGGSGGSSSAAA
jgi:putative FmdB family regulatory protein